MDEYALGKEISKSHIVFCKDIFECPGRLEKELYGKMVENTVITCVDIFVVNLDTSTYFALTRKDEPAKDFQWIPGGRQEKFKSIEEIAQKKCKDEVGIDIEVYKVLGAWSTVFPRSCWNCPTHTTNIAVVAFCKSQACNLDAHHEQGRWLPLGTLPGNGYLDLAHTEMLKALRAYKISCLHQAVLTQNQNREIINQALADLEKYPQVNIDKRVEKKQLLERVLTLNDTSTNREIVELLLKFGATLPIHASNQLDPKNYLHRSIRVHMYEKLISNAARFTNYITSSYPFDR